MLITRCKDTYFFLNCKRIHDFFRITSPDECRKGTPSLLLRKSSKAKTSNFIYLWTAGLAQCEPLKKIRSRWKKNLKVSKIICTFASKIVFFKYMNLGYCPHTSCLTQCYAGATYSYYKIQIAATVEYNCSCYCNNI